MTNWLFEESLLLYNKRWLLSNRLPCGVRNYKQAKCIVSIWARSQYWPQNAWGGFECSRQHWSQHWIQKCSFCHPFLSSIITKPFHPPLFICPSLVPLRTLLHLCRFMYFSEQASLFTTDKSGGAQLLVTPQPSITANADFPWEEEETAQTMSRSMT